MQIKQKKLLNISYFSVLSSESHGEVGAAVATTEGGGGGNRAASSGKAQAEPASLYAGSSIAS